ncbi:MAG: hypothetical protein ACE14M_04670 [Terriglobales bacterium]
MSDRKYRQPGYQDRGEQRDKPQSGGAPKPRPRDSTFGPRPLQMPGTRAISRCAQCGVVLPALGEITQCPQCKAPLHTCKQCAYFDPASRFECRQPVPEPIAKKDALNNCSFYAISVRVERETTTGVSATGGSGRVEDARRAFENLFKK